MAALFAVADCMAGMAPTPGELANHLAFLHMDLTDPDFHRLAFAQARAARDEIDFLPPSGAKTALLEIPNYVLERTS